MLVNVKADYEYEGYLLNSGSKDIRGNEEFEAITNSDCYRKSHIYC